jgi:hypothetical protein
MFYWWVGGQEWRIEILTEESLLEVDFSLPCLLNSWRVAAYFRYSIIWFESTIMSGRRPEFIASEAHVYIEMRGDPGKIS